jgi:hypothetical protein
MIRAVDARVRNRGSIRFAVDPAHLSTRRSSPALVVR